MLFKSYRTLEFRNDIVFLKYVQLQYIFSGKYLKFDQ